MTAPGKVSITVLIPNYNHARLLPEALDSLVAQSRQPDAIYVLDDASTDNSVEVVESYQARYPHIQLVRREKNLGVCGNINEFVKKVETTFLYSLAADDLMLPGYIEGAYDILNKHPDAGICTAETVSLMLDGSRKRGHLKWSDRPAWISPQELTRVARGHCTGQCFYNTKALQKIDGFPENLRWHSDHFAGWVLAARHGACYLPNPGAVFRMSQQGYCAAGSRSGEHRNVLLNALEYVRRPEFAEIKPILRDAHVLSIFDEGLFSALCRDRRNHYFLSPSFLWMLMWRQIRLRFRHPLPEPAKHWIRRRFKPQKSGATH